MTGTPQILSNSGTPSLNLSSFPRMLLKITPFILDLSGSGMSSIVPRAYANAPPHSTLTTRTTLASATTAAPMLAMSLS